MSCVNRHLHSHSGGRTLLRSRTEEFTLVLSYLIQAEGAVDCKQSFPPPVIQDKWEIKQADFIIGSEFILVKERS